MSFYFAEMTEQRAELKDELTKMNREIEELESRRKRFLDENMHHFAEFSIGETVYDVRNGLKTTCVEHYLMNKTYNMPDNALYCDCRFKNGDNTSRYGSYHPYVSVADYEGRTEKYNRVLQAMARK